MGAHSPSPAEPNVTEIEMELARRPHGLSDTQIAFDVVAGVVCPALLLWLDPAIFHPTVASRGCLPPYWAGPTYLVLGALAFLLLAWVIAGPRHPRLGMLLAGPFALGAVLWLIIAVVLLPFALPYAILLSGILAFTPWLTAISYFINCIRAVRSGAEQSGLLTAFLFLGGFGVPFVIILVVFGSQHRQARLIEDQFLSASRAEHEYAVEAILSGVGVDFSRIALQYELLKPDSPAQKRVADQFFTLSGIPIDEALRRLHEHDFGGVAERDPEEPPETETADQRMDRLIDALFDPRDAVAHDATNELIGQRGIDLERIIRGYKKLAATDPRRERVERAYGTLTGENLRLVIQGKELKPETPLLPPRKPLEPEPGL